MTNLADDLALALGAESVRIQRIPGKSSLGMEIPNNKREIIKLRDILESEPFVKSPSKLTLALGKTVHDEVYVTDLGAMPHLLVAGATGTGKSVCLNALIASILYKATPSEVKLLLIDPKRLEFSLYDGIPHLLSPVINDAKKAAVVLMDTVKKMEERYYVMQQFKVRNIDQYNHHIAELLQEKKGKLTEEDKTRLKPMPYIVIIIDELADLIMVSGQDVDFAIGRLAQLARAVGIHLVLATQRPSTDIITGTIKNNFPSRIAFRVPSKIDSRVILDSNGAEKLLGMGDMLFIPPNYPRMVRLHCSYVSIPEVRRLVNYVKKQGLPEYDEHIVDVLQRTGEQAWGDSDEKDEMFDEAVKLDPPHRAGVRLLPAETAQARLRPGLPPDRSNGAGRHPRSVGRQQTSRDPGRHENLYGNFDEKSRLGRLSGFPWPAPPKPSTWTRSPPDIVPSLDLRSGGRWAGAVRIGKTLRTKS